MQKFTDSHMRTSLNEQLDKPIRTLDEFVSFGKSVCKSVLQESYSDAAVEKNLIGLYNSCGCDLNETMKAFDTITMPRKEFGETMNCKLNQLFEELKSNPADTTISVRIVSLFILLGYIILFCFRFISLMSNARRRVFLP